MPDLATRLLAMRACPDAVQWARGYTDDAAAWRECQRGDWMLWLLVRLNVDRKRLVLAACECARLSLHSVSAAASAAAASAAYAASLSQCADIVRWHFPKVPNVQ